MLNPWRSASPGPAWDSLNSDPRSLPLLERPCSSTLDLRTASKGNHLLSSWRKVSSINGIQPVVFQDLLGPIMALVEFPGPESQDPTNMLCWGIGQLLEVALTQSWLKSFQDM